MCTRMYADGSEAYREHIVHRAGEDQREADDRDQRAAQPGGAEDDIVEDHQKQNRRHALNQPEHGVCRAVDDRISSAAEHEHREADDRAEDDGAQRASASPRPRICILFLCFM